ncbi:ABC transporter ATP-binding protein/permease [Candidatus Pandoraea novymonadis]|uniref:Vitamin B12 transport ATP-binding protein BacA n=1 Tax=Candidatus Pandoraea novymonadis TaxID=1808959 RepID=A0ABX5FCK5_9BURK|nr:ABC transporter ATP-binding protein/permease [Candidatus Pandoraea novymonadis]PSB91563.1 Vitamin B12 transport ATP-binding protein BacA [Candidatus Pandoraea novymonadis]
MTQALSAWQLIRPYWVSEQRWQGRGLLALVIILNLAIVYINVRINLWNVNFFNALQDHNWSAFRIALLEFILLAFTLVLITTFRVYFRQMLEIKWRQWLTNFNLRKWLEQQAYYWIEREHLVDNPDQRISEDLHSLTSTSLALFINLLSTLVTLLSFVTILWTLSGALSISLWTMNVSIPGYMVWVAAIYAIGGSFIIFRIGQPMMNLNYHQQKVEADFRFLLVRLRENSEQIALYRGESVEQDRLLSTFDKIRSNCWKIMHYTKHLMLANSVYTQMAIIFPVIAAAPRYFAGAFTFGILMRIVNAFGHVSDAFSWFINSFPQLTEWKATVNRLREFSRAVEVPTAQGNITHTTGKILATDNLRLSLPDGTPLLTVGSIKIPAGTRWMIRGPSGCGKSTLLLAIAGLWPFGNGCIVTPAKARLLFLPQKSYLPISSLKVALAYPSDTEAFDDASCSAALESVKLGPYVQHLQTEAHWGQRLSGGEQQRLAAARALLQKPDYLFLDEATSALDTEAEEHIYAVLRTQLTNTAIVSVTHRETLLSFHEHTLTLTRKSLKSNEIPIK